MPRILGKLILSMVVTSDHEDEFAVEEKRSRPQAKRIANTKQIYE